MAKKKKEIQVSEVQKDDALFEALGNSKKKKRRKILITVVSIVVLVGIVGIVGVSMLQKKVRSEFASASGEVLAYEAGTGTISTVVSGSGSLTDMDLESVKVPDGVEITEILVKTNDKVAEGDILATVDMASVMRAMADLQVEIEDLDEQINEAEDDEASDVIYAGVSGRVKKIYAKKDADVAETMYENGALALLSLDGYMAVDITTDSDLKTGSTVQVILEDGTKTDGKVESNLAGKMTVTVKDNAYTVDQSVQVQKEDGTTIGSGTLYIFSPWNATAYAGTVDSIKVSKGDTVDTGDTLMKLTDTGYTATYSQLVSKRQAYEDLMIELFKMYQTETITAPCEGIVLGIDKNSNQLLGVDNSNYTLSLLSNAPNGNDEMLYTNYIGKVSVAGENSWTLHMNP